MTTPDFHDERVQRIADVTFNDEDGEGAVAEWWDMLASIDADLATLTEGGELQAPTGASGGAEPDRKTGSAPPSSVSAATLTATVREKAYAAAHAMRWEVEDRLEEFDAALSVLEQQHADAERLGEAAADYERQAYEQFARAEAAEAALQAAHNALRGLMLSTGCWCNNIRGLHDLGCKAARAALAAASAAAEHTETET